MSFLHIPVIACVGQLGHLSFRRTPFRIASAPDQVQAHMHQPAAKNCLMSDPRCVLSILRTTFRTWCWPKVFFCLKAAGSFARASHMSAPGAMVSWERRREYDCRGFDGPAICRVYERDGLRRATEDAQTIFPAHATCWRDRHCQWNIEAGCCTFDLNI